MIFLLRISFFFSIRIDSLLVSNDKLNECHLNISIGDGTTTSTTNGDLTSLCCVCQDRASGRHYGVLSCEVRQNFSDVVVLDHHLPCFPRVVKVSLNEVYVSRFCIHV